MEFHYSAYMIWWSECLIRFHLLFFLLFGLNLTWWSLLITPSTSSDGSWGDLQSSFDFFPLAKCVSSFSVFSDSLSTLYFFSFFIRVSLALFLLMFMNFIAISSFLHCDLLGGKAGTRTVWRSCSTSSFSLSEIKIRYSS